MRMAVCIAGLMSSDQSLLICNIGGPNKRCVLGFHVSCRDEVVMIGTSHSSETFGLLDTEQPIRVGKTVGPKAHVLVCAPSNSALDEIVARLLQHGVLDW